MKQSYLYRTSVLFLCLFVVSIYTQNLRLRSSYNIPLIKLKVINDPDDPEVKRVRIAEDESKEYFEIGAINDLHVRFSRQNTEKTTYAEQVDQASALTPFERKQLEKVLESFIATLEIFEHDLEEQRWDRCLYLDSFLPRFLKGFYYFSTALFNSTQVLPETAKISDDWFDVSLQSIKSDQRLDAWLDKKDYIVKLRIVVRELLFQLKLWQDKQLHSSDNDPYIEYSESLKDTYSLFVRMYFNKY